MRRDSLPPPSQATQQGLLSIMSLVSAKARKVLKARLTAEWLRQLPGLEALHSEPVAEEVAGPSGQVYNDTSIFCLRPGHQPRKGAILLVESWYFDPLILFTILANCATMAWQSPLDPQGTWKAGFIEQCEWVFLAVFTVELLVKVVAYGFLMHRNAYLRNPWCQLDFVVVSLAWLPILFPSMGNYSVLRAFRALRPLRALKRMPGMPVLVQWILDVIPAMANVLMLFVFVFLVFGIVGMELFKGSLRNRCALPGFAELAAAADGMEPVELAAAQAVLDTGRACTRGSTKSIAMCADGTTCETFASNPMHGVISFDSVPTALIALVMATTFDDWADAMYLLMGSFSPYAWLYFVLIVLIAGFFVVNLFLAVVYLEFGSSKARVDASANQTKQPVAAALQDSGDMDALLGSDVELSDAVQRSPSPVGHRASSPSFGDRAASSPVFTPVSSPAGGRASSPATVQSGGCLAEVANSSWLSNLSTILVILNMLLMCMPYEGMPRDFAAALEQGATFITWMFIGEMAIKLMGLGCSGYWSDGWNVLDGSIVIMSIVEMVFTALTAGSGVKLSFLRVLRILRVMRILRLMRSWRGLYRIVQTFMRAMPQMANVVVLILLCMFMFALLGMQLFGGIFTTASGYSLTPCPGEVCDGGLEEKPHFHFDYCAPAMISIFIILTGEWVDAMEPVAAELGPQASSFFIMVVIIGKFLLMNLLIAVILYEFADDAESPGSSPQKTNRSSPVDFASASPDGASSPLPIRSPSPEGAAAASNARQLWSLAAAKTVKAAAWPDDYSLYCFSPENHVRRFCHSLLRHTAFDPTIIAAIIISSICLALDSPRLEVDSELATTLYWLNIVFTLLFFSEMCTKVIALGFCFGKDAYLK